MILFRVEHLQQCGGRITPEVHSHLVHFVKQEQRVLHRHLGHILQNLARHGADIGAAVTANFRLVAHAAKRHAHKFAVGRTRDRLPQRSLAHAGRADQAQDRRLHLVHTLLHRQIFNDAFFDLFQPIVVGFQHFFRSLQVSANLGFLFPRQSYQHINIVAHNGRLG